VSAPRSGPARPTARAGATRARSRPAASPPPARSGLAGQTGRVSALVADWGPTLARILLGLVLAWFGYHELVQPALWTGYLPVVAPRSTAAIVLVLAHGWILLMLAVALVAGLMARLAAALAAVLVLEIVITLTVTGGLTDLTMRDVGVLGLAVALTGRSEQRLMLTR
jgi:uncharacterized membrane protein YphA (DoxX/SURF4 family)